MAASAICSTSPRLPTSASTAIASAPFCDRRAATSSSVSPLRAARTNFAPCSAAASAVAKPIPLEAPVMTMTCSLTGFREMAMNPLRLVR